MTNSRAERVKMAAAILRHMQAKPLTMKVLNNLSTRLTTVLWNAPHIRGGAFKELVLVKRHLRVMADAPELWNLKMALLGVVELLMANGNDNDG